MYATVNGNTSISHPHLLLNPKPVLNWMPPKKNNNSFQLWILPFVRSFESPLQWRGISFSVSFHTEKHSHGGIAWALLCSMPGCYHATSTTRLPLDTAVPLPLSAHPQRLKWQMQLRVDLPCNFLLSTNETTNAPDVSRWLLDQPEEYFSKCWPGLK